MFFGDELPFHNMKLSRNMDRPAYTEIVIT
jgi:hypothetical protein